MYVLHNRTETRRALDIWRRASNLVFTERTSGDVDILIDFFTGEHTDGPENAFDGPGIYVCRIPHIIGA